MSHGKTQFPFICVCVVCGCMYVCVHVGTYTYVCGYVHMHADKVDLKYPPPLLSTLYLRRQGLLLNLELNILARLNTRIILHCQ